MWYGMKYNIETMILSHIIRVREHLEPFKHIITCNACTYGAIYAGGSSFGIHFTHVEYGM